MAAKTGCFKHEGVVAEADSADFVVQKEEARQEKLCKMRSSVWRPSTEGIKWDMRRS